jgi:hypothetical protein
MRPSGSGVGGSGRDTPESHGVANGGWATYGAWPTFCCSANWRRIWPTSGRYARSSSRFAGPIDGPPPWNPPAFWEELYAELATGLKLKEKTLEEAVREARASIGAIDAAGTQWPPHPPHSHGGLGGSQGPWTSCPLSFLLPVTLPTLPAGIGEPDVDADVDAGRREAVFSPKNIRGK